MIQLGHFQVSLYPNSGILLELRGKIIFHGKCSIGNNSFISTGEQSILEFGKNFSSTTTLRLTCYDHIKFCDNVLVGWNCMFMDIDFHRLTRVDGKPVNGYGPITIGKNTWIANGCRILKNTSIPDNSVIAAYTILSGRVETPENLS
jgi:acetyltransferase-like isoleucine patch superfamily enzyme